MKILLTEKIHEEGMRKLEEYGEVVLAKDPKEETLLGLIGDCDAMVVRSTPVTDTLISAGKKLKVIGRHGIGVDQIDLESAKKHGIKVVNTPQANVISVAEQVVADMMYLCKRNHKADAAMRAGEFSQTGSLPALVNKLGYNTLELYGKKVGMIGMGKIARRALQYCVNGFEMKAYGYDPYLTDEQIKSANAVPCKTVADLVSQVDFVSIHVPLTPETKDLINYEMLCKMKSSAFIINTSRGGIINEEDLCKAIDEGKIAGAAVDVYAKEPPAKDYPFFSRDKILVTPHMAAMTDGALYRMAIDVADGVIDVLDGRDPKSWVNK